MDQDRAASAHSCGHSPCGIRRRYRRVMTVTIQLPADLSAALGALECSTDDVIKALRGLHPPEP